MTNLNNRVFGLDLMRCVAVLLVLLTHTLTIITDNKLVDAFCDYAAVVGVELFFVLSGFLIGSIIIKIHLEEEHTSFKRVKYFWIRRWFRTLPNYYLILFIYLIMHFVGSHQFLFNDYKHISYIFFIQNLKTGNINDFFGVSWSLSIEEWFYLLFPLVLFFSQFFFKSKFSSLIVTILIFILLPLIARMVISNAGIAWDSGFRKTMPIRLDSIGIGVLASFVKVYYSESWVKFKIRSFILSLVTIIPLLIIFYYKFVVSYDHVHQIEQTDAGFFLKTYFFTFFSISIALMLPMLWSIRVKKNNYFSSIVTLISLISYSIYLIHPIIINLVDHLHIRYVVIIFLLVWIFTISFSYIQYNYFEKKMTSLRDNFGEKKDAVGL